MSIESFFVIHSKLLEVVRINIKANLSYVLAAWGAFVSNIIQIFIFYFIWMAVYQDNYSLNGISKTDMISYIILSRVLYTQVTWGIIYYIGHKVHNGQIAMDLLRPMDLQLYMYTGRMGDLLAFGCMNAIPTLFIVSFFLGFNLPESPITVLYFLLSLFISLSISFFIEFTIGLLTFYTNYSWGVQSLHEALMSFFSGALIPLVFLPGWLRSIVEILPFKDIIYTPITIYLEMVQGEMLFRSILTQIIWLIIIVTISRSFLNFAIKKVTVQGG